MKLCVSDLWDEELARECARVGVHEIYSSLRMSPIGSVRPAIVLPEVSMKEAEKHIKMVHSLGMKFSYVANASCLGNMEFDSTGRRKILEFFEKIVEIGADQLIIGTPILIEMVKRNFPKVKIKASEICDVNSPKRAAFYEELGVDVITISFMCNRNFELLQSIRKAVKCELEVIVNQSCLLGCPRHDYHVNIASHASQEDHPLHGFYMDYALISCVKKRLLSPEEIIKSPWIRPEDVAEYRKIGIDRFKISNRLQPKEYALRCIHAYANGEYKGNLADLLNPLNIRLPIDPRKPRLKGFSPEEWEVATKAWSVPEPYVYIDNKALDGFIEFFKRNRCYAQCRADCRYCEEIATKVVHIDEGARDSYIAFLDQLLTIVLDLKLPLRLPVPANQFAIAWSEDSLRLLSKLADSVIPEAFRNTARRAIAKKAELYAKEQGAQTVRIEDVIKACLSETPKPFQPLIIDALEKEGISTKRHT